MNSAEILIWHWRDKLLPVIIICHFLYSLCSSVACCFTLSLSRLFQHHHVDSFTFRTFIKLRWLSTHSNIIYVRIRTAVWGCTQITHNNQIQEFSRAVVKVNVLANTLNPNRQKGYARPCVYLAGVDSCDGILTCCCLLRWHHVTYHCSESSLAEVKCWTCVFSYPCGLTVIRTRLLSRNKMRLLQTLTLCGFFFWNGRTNRDVGLITVRGVEGNHATSCQELSDWFTLKPDYVTWHAHERDTGIPPVRSNSLSLYSSLCLTFRKFEMCWEV